ncbi:S subunit [Maribacter dokdonensis]|uniref:restriction endonuclease subunit S n=1 Tax=Maribacter dokdonensis TaxID=320912 RepID=UPI001B05B9B3|nr:restriction endonuclease subunit S [Maribacter dokdonensis]CAG2534341.1 S subunit [Maribacter dokdonensis]
MPKNWKTYKLSEIATKIGSGATPRGGKEAYKESGISLIRSQNVLDFTFSTDGLAFIDELQADKLKNVIIESKDVLLNITGDSVARVCQVPDEWIPARVNQHVAIIRADNKLLNPDFLKYSLLTYQNKNELLNLSSAGATRKAITKSMIEDFEITLPPLPEQKGIAIILSVIDDKIENNLAMNKTLEDMAMALYKHWFVDFGPFQEGKFIDSELGEIPEGWELKRLPEISINHNKKRKPLSTRVRAEMQGKYPYYGATKALDFINDFRFDGEFILLAEDGTVKTDRDTPFLQFVEGQFWVSNHAHVLTGNDLYSNEFVYLSLANSNVVPIITGAVQLKINKQNLESLTFITPSTEILRDFETQVIHWFKQIRLNILETETLTKLRDTLLPKLISGEVRLNEFENK